VPIARLWPSDPGQPPKCGPQHLRRAKQQPQPVVVPAADWLGRKDSNLRSPDPESGALPLGHSPVDEPDSCSDRAHHPSSHLRFSGESGAHPGRESGAHGKNRKNHVPPRGRLRKGIVPVMPYGGQPAGGSDLIVGQAISLPWNGATIRRGRVRHGVAVLRAAQPHRQLPSGPRATARGHSRGPPSPSSCCSSSTGSSSRASRVSGFGRRARRARCRPQ
jgi:hypothetical protein